MRNLISAILILPFLAMAAKGFHQEGVTEPIARAVVSSTVSGQIDQIEVHEGDFVKKGEVILSLEHSEEEIQVSMTKIVMESKADLASAQQKLETYQKDYQATKTLFETSNSVSEDQVWEKELNFKLAEAEVDKLKMLEEKETLEHSLAKAQLSKRIIRAPFDGVIVKINKNPSEGVQALEPLYEIVDVRRCRLVTYILAENARDLRKGGEIDIELDGAKTPRTRKGRIEFISPVVDKASMLRTVKIIFDNKDGSIEPGVTGRILR